MQQREQERQPFISLESEIINFSKEFKHIDKQFFSIDHPDTILSDDALHIKQVDPHWYEVSTAVSAVSNKTNFILKKLPAKFSYHRPGEEKHYSLSDNKFREVLLFKYVTDGQNIMDPYFQPAIIQSEQVSHKRIPVTLKRSMKAITGQDCSEKMLAIFNTTYNLALGEFANQREIPILFHNYKGYKTFYSCEPVIHEGLNIPAYTRATSPLRAMKDCITQSQVIESVKNNGSVMNKKNIEYLCELFNRDMERAA